MEAGLYSGIREGTQDCYLQGRALGQMSQHQNLTDVDTFIFTIKTDSAAAGRTITLPLLSTGTYNFWIDWGDGRTDYVRSYGQIYSGQTVARTHLYPTNFTEYTIRIKGICKGWSYSLLTAEQLKLISIERFGCLELINDTIQTTTPYFSSCANLNLSNVKDTLNLGNTTNLNYLFNEINTNINLLNNWNVSKVTDMASTFSNSVVPNTKFNSPLSSWDVSNVTNMSFMFRGKTAFNQPINNWNVGKVTNMQYMFYGASSFNQPLNEWEQAWATKATVTNMTGMFANATSFNQSLQQWSTRTSNVTNMSFMFQNAVSYNQPMVNWRTSKVTTMQSMFNGATSFDQNIGSWNLTACTNLTGFMTGVNMSPIAVGGNPAGYNLSEMYKGWVTNLLQNNVLLDVGNSKYTNNENTIQSKNLLSRPGVVGAKQVTMASISIIYTNVVKVTTAIPHGLIIDPVPGPTGVQRIFIANAITANDAAYLNKLWTVTVLSDTEFVLNTSVYSIGGALISPGDVIISYGWTITEPTIPAY